jgi:uncharacterized lipoprotein YddW (UPF0748 family)
MGRETQGFAALSPSQRSLAASIGSLTNWSRINSPESRRAATAPARAAMRRTWEAQADPDGVLSREELDAAVARLRSAHMRRMALKSAQARSGDRPSRTAA